MSAPDLDAVWDRLKVRASAYDARREAERRAHEMHAFVIAEAEAGNDRAVEFLQSIHPGPHP